MSKRNICFLSDVVAKLNEFAPLSLAESWDNVGLLIEPSTSTTKPIKNILFTNDLTEAVMSEAIGDNVNLIVSYHPPLFAPLKRITQNTWKERIVANCLENKIALYSPHTAWDSVENGVNDWLASFPTVGAADQKIIVPIHPVVDRPTAGAGRLITFTTESIIYNVADAIEHLKKMTKLKHLNVALGCDRTAQSPIRSIAVCAGSGTSVLKSVVADLYVTGEMSHHDVLDATHRNITVILTNHSNSERGYLQEFIGKFRQLLGAPGDDIKMTVSTKDSDPLLMQ